MPSSISDTDHEGGDAKPGTSADSESITNVTWGGGGPARV